MTAISAQLVSVALPNGFDPGSGRARISIFLSPRLDSGDNRLDSFADFVAWPATLQAAGVQYLVQVDGQDPVLARVVSSPPRSELWRAMFETSMFVRTRSMDHIGDRAMVNYPVSDIESYIRRRYQAVTAAHPSTLPPRGTITENLVDVLGGARRDAGGRAELDRAVVASLDRARQRARGRTLDPAAEGPPTRPAIVADDDLPPGVARDFAQFQLFHHRLADSPRGAPPISSEERRTQLDFHDVLSLITDHPPLLRQLGLVVDLDVAASVLPAATVAQPGRIKARPVWVDGGLGATVDAPWVAFARADALFSPAPRDGTSMGSDVSEQRLVRLGNGLWDVLQLDVDGAAFKLLMAADSAASGSAHDPSVAAELASDDGVEPLPALRTAGFVVTRRQTPDVIQHAVDRQEYAADRQRQVVDHETGRSASDDLVFFADDVTRGFRMDVFETRTGRWQSLHRRRVRYVVTNGPSIDDVTDEGFIRRAVTERPAAVDAASADAVAPEIYVHDALARWDGWSLAAAHPGKSISADPRAPDAAVPETMPQRAENLPIAEGVPLAIAVSAEPRSLPRLRFGDSYRIRLRSVDLAGNGLSLGEADVVVASIDGMVLPADPAGQPFRRYEPLSSPELVPRAELHEGESLARLVIRSDHGLTAEQWSAQQDTKILPTCDRHVAPPKVSQLLAEHHGRFDESFGTGAAADLTYARARKEKGRLADSAILLSDGSITAQPVTVVSSLAGDYVINRAARLAVPYLPDPLAQSVSITGIPGVPDGTHLFDDFLGLVQPLDETNRRMSGSGIVTIAFASLEKWPEIEPFILRVAEGSADPEWDAVARILTIYLPQAGHAQLRISCAPPRNRLADLAVRQWTLDALAGGVADLNDPGDLGAADPFAAHDDLAAAGQVWSLSPSRAVDIVHAVQRPVQPPSILDLAASRDVGATFALLAGQIHVHGASSDRLELLAEWSDPVDRLDDAGPSTVEGHARVLDVGIHLVGDAGQRAPRSADPNVVPAGEYDEASDIVRLLGPAPGDESGRQFLCRHDFGDTRHRSVHYRARASSRFREYFSPAVADDPANISLDSVPSPVSVPSSARPAAPRLLYVVPTFGWQRGPSVDDPATQVSTRTGGGLRIYLDRPWYSSGDGEQLGVVLWADPDSPVPAVAGPLISQQAADPIWNSAAVEQLLRPSDFGLTTPSATMLVLEELAGIDHAFVAVVGHAVTFDTDRRLWYADLRIDPGLSYMPFVRLALARWQPDSVAGCELSRIVLADFAQLSPDRSVTIQRHPADTFTDIELTVTGRTYRNVAGRTGSGEDLVGSVVDVSVEQRLPGTQGEVGWIDAGADTGVTIVTTGQPFDPVIRWKGSVRVARNGTPYRIVVREHENVGNEARSRMVFAETIEL